MSSDKVLGIDLGTTNSVFGVMEAGEDRVLESHNGNKVIPSVVSFREGEVLVGEPAQNIKVQNPQKTVSSIKRKMGREDYVEEIGAEEYTPQEISSFILRRIKADAEQYINEELDRCVIGVPAYFTDKQRQATIEAGELAGLDVERVINEPTAAAIAYALDNQREQTILVFDLGGGTFDVSVLDLQEGVYDVVATNGNNRLGGDDWTKALVDHFADDFEDKHGISLRDRPRAMERLWGKCEEVKKQLSSTYKWEFTIPFITTPSGSDPINMSGSITRERFDNLTMSLRNKIDKPVEQVMDDAGVNELDIDDIILVGGATRMPQIQDKVEELFGMEPIKHIEPDKAVAKGAIIQGGIITGETQDVTLLDVTPRSLGIEVKGGLFERLIPRNSTLPNEASKIFTTNEDDQKSVDIRVYQGEEQVAERNEFLDEFVLTGIPRAEAGTPRIEVTFRIDLDGIVHVSAEELASGRMEEIEIVGGSGLAGETLNQMKKRQDEIIEESKEVKYEKYVRNRAMKLANEAESTLKDENTEIDVGLATEMDEYISEMEELLEEDDLDVNRVEFLIEQLERLVGKFSPSVVTPEQ